MTIDIAELGLSVNSDGFVVATSRMGKFTKGAKKAETATERLIRKTEKLNATAKKLGRSLSMAVTLPILGMGFAAIKAFGNFDEAMVSSMAIMGDLSDTMKRDMADTAKEVALTTAFSAKQAAESYYFLASAGLSAAASIAALPKVAAFAQAGTFDMAKATDILTDAQSALGKVMEDPIANMKEMVALGDVLVKANTIANASVQQFGEALTNKAGTAMKDLHIDIESGIAVLAAWADQGIKGTEAGEKFNIVTRDLQTAIRNNAEEFEKHNVNVFNAEGGFRNLGDIITDLEGALAGMSTQMKGTTLSQMGFQDRSVIAIRSLIGLSDKIKDYESGLRSAGGIMQEVADKQMKTFNKQMGLLKDKLVGIGIELGEKLVPLMEDLKDTLDDFLDWISDAVDTFTSYDIETQKMILGAIAFAAALGPLLIVLALMSQAVIVLLPLMASLAGVFAVAMPFAAAALGLGLFIDLIGNQYIASIEKGIEATGNFNTALKNLSMFSMKENLETVNEQLDILKTRYWEQKIALDEVDEKMANTDPAFKRFYAYQKLEKQQAELNAGMVETNRFIGQSARLRDSYVKRINESEKAIAAELKVTKDAVEAEKALIAAKKLTGEELEDLTEWWAALRGEIDPMAEATREYVAAIHLLKLAIDQWDLSEEEIAAAIKHLQNNMRDASGETDAWRESIEKLTNTWTKLESLEGIFVADDLRKEITALEDGAEAWREYSREQFIAAKIAELAVDAGEDQIKQVRELAGALYDLRDPIDDLGASMQNFGAMAGEALRSIQSSMTDGSKAYEALNVAIQIANVAQAIGAVLNQAQGDPYTAFARMAAMAAAVAALGVSISGFNSAGFSDPTEQRQEEQGTGSVLGDAQAKSESIVKATEITATATRSLVGINRGMLRALQSLNAGLSGASGFLARGAANGDFSELPDTDLSGLVKGLLSSGASFLPLIGNFIGKLLNKLFGGKSKIIDEGIAILAGTIEEAINGTLVLAFQEVKFKKWVFGKTKFREDLIALGGGATSQIGLIFQAIADTVREGALALGISGEAIQAAMDSFRIEEMRISLEDLSAEEQQAAIEAVFSQIFDDLALAVVPFVEQFQKVGEGLGETLIRVATSVQVMREAIKMMGLSLVETDPEKFAQIAVGLIEMAGGIDTFISSMQNFIDKFATDDWKLDIATKAINSAFEQMGLTLPDTRDGLWDLVQGLDLTTEAGQRQLVTILELTDFLDTYYGMLEDGEAKREEAGVAVLDSIHVVTKAAELLGFAMETVDPEDFKAAADALIELAGGIDIFLIQMNSFFETFAPDSVKFIAVTKDMTDAFAAVGLEIPATAEGMWELMQSLDGTTEEGRKQIAMLLAITGTAAIYYATLERLEAERQAGLDETAAIEAQLLADQLAALEELAIAAEIVLALFESFEDAFAPDSAKFARVSKEMNDAFDAVGLTIPDTTEGLWDLMQSLDGTTEEGRRQIDMLLSIIGLSSEYYRMVEAQEAERLAGLDQEARRLEELARLREKDFNLQMEALFHIQAIARGVVDSLTSLRDMIISDMSTPGENFNRARDEAERLAIALSTMTDPDKIEATVQRIEQLTRTAFGMLDEDQKRGMGQQFLTFLDAVQEMALQRLSLAADTEVAGSAFTPEEILARFNEEVTDPLILVAGLQESAALKLAEAADHLMNQVPGNFYINANSDGQPVALSISSEMTSDISAAVQAGMQAGAEAMAEAAAAIVTTGASTDATSKASAQHIAQAIRSLPARIVVEPTPSEFSS